MSEVSVCAESEFPAEESANRQAGASPRIASASLAKEDRLKELFRGFGSVIVAYSGGVDSSYVAYVANEALGDRAICITGQSASLPQHMRGEIESVVSNFAFRQETIQTEELNNPHYQANNPSRCYFCKDELYSKLDAIARERDINVIVDGSTTDDLGDYRPGRRAAQQHNIRSPLIEVGLCKAEVRELSRKAGLPTWDKPASPCLSSRIAYGTTVTIERLSRIDRGEQILRELGFREFRVRHHDTLVRLEISPAEMERVLNKRVIDHLTARFLELGFKYVTLDLQGFRSGSMNEALSLPTITGDSPGDL